MKAHVAIVPPVIQLTKYILYSKVYFLNFELIRTNSFNLIVLLNPGKQQLLKSIDIL